MDLSFLKRQLWDADFPAPEADLSGKTGVVTGCNVGLGLETVAHLMRMKTSRIIMAVRTISKGEEAKNQLLARIPEYKGTLEVWELDLASFASTKSFAARINESLDKLDIAILNAGVASQTWKTTKDGWEETIQVNCISTGLLAILLLPILNKTASTTKPHLVIVSSEVHVWAKFAVQDQPNILDALNDKNQFVGSDRYNISKLLDVFLTRELASHPATRNINVTTPNPGLCVSELLREMPTPVKFVLRKLSYTTEKGSRNFAYAASAPDIPSGSFIQMAAPAEPSAFVLSEKGQECQKKVWEEMKTIWVKQEPKVKEILG